MTRARSSVTVEPHEVGATVTVVAADRVGLLADVAGGLAALRVPVHAARAWAQVDAEGEWGVSSWEVPDAYLDATKVRDRIRRVVEGSQRLPDLPERPDGELPPIVEVRPDASRASLVLEIRTSDRPGVVHRVLTTLAGLGPDRRLGARLDARPAGGRRVLRPGGRRRPADRGARRGGRPRRTHRARRLSAGRSCSGR